MSDSTESLQWELAVIQRRIADLQLRLADLRTQEAEVVARMKAAQRGPK